MPVLHTLQVIEDALIINTSGGLNIQEGKGQPRWGTIYGRR
ncbi:hypothetical protein [Glutamicibacter ardleyensis]|nr:hypothetical protein [Glutamicibacter ardleyensis]